MPSSVFTRIKIISSIASRGIGWGILTGAFVGPAVGVSYLTMEYDQPSFGIIGLIVFTAFVGGFFGLFIGALIGLLAGIISSVFFFPLKNPRLYRLILTLTCALLSSTLTIYFTAVFFLAGPSNVVIIRLFPLAIMVFMSVWGSQRLATWYINYMSLQPSL